MELLPLSPSVKDFWIILRAAWVSFFVTFLWRMLPQKSRSENLKYIKNEFTNFLWVFENSNRDVPNQPNNLPNSNIPNNFSCIGCFANLKISFFFFFFWFFLFTFLDFLGFFLESLCRELRHLRSWSHKPLKRLYSSHGLSVIFGPVRSRIPWLVPFSFYFPCRSLIPSVHSPFVVFATIKTVIFSTVYDMRRA